MKNIAPIIKGLLLIFILFTLPMILPAGNWEESAIGRTAIFRMENAPYPDSSRADGYTRQDEFYPAEIHYSDPSVAVFIPRKFQSGEAVNLLFYFHGHNNNVRKSLDNFNLRKMVASSEKNVILVFPQGPKDSRDSGCGKLEAENGFTNLVEEILDSLKTEGIIEHQELGRIILSGHSGAYKVIGRILKQGGLTEKISEVYLLDATYGQLNEYLEWVTSDETARLVSIFTDHLALENVILMKWLSRNNMPYLLLAEEEVQPVDLQSRILFLHAENLTHGETVNWLERFLISSSLPAIQ